MPWRKISAESGQPEYWHNTDTDETSWDPPPDNAANVAQLEGERNDVEILGPSTMTMSPNVQAGAATVQINERGEYAVTVRLRTGIKFQVEPCKADMSVLALKELIAEYEQGMPAYMQRLSCEGKPMNDVDTLRFYEIGPDKVVLLHEKSSEDIEYSETNKVDGQIGRIKVGTHGMHGFAGCLTLAILCAGAGIPIYLLATFQNQYSFYGCQIVSMTGLDPCGSIDNIYFCPVELTVTCDSMPTGCGLVHNTTALTETEQSDLFYALPGDYIDVFCCTSDFWCSSELYLDGSLADKSQFPFSVPTREANDVTIYTAWGVIGLGCFALLTSIVLIIVVASAKKYKHDNRVHVVNNRQRGLKVGN